MKLMPVLTLASLSLNIFQIEEPDIEVLKPETIIEELSKESDLIPAESIPADEIKGEQTEEKEQEEIEKGIKIEVPPHSGFKSFEPYTDFGKRYDQYALQQMAETDPDGLRVVNDRYCVAIGSYFNTSIGQTFDIILENGEIIPCVMADLKDDSHTDNDNIYTVHSDCCSEFIIDPEALREDLKYTGDISNKTNTWQSPVVSFVIYDEYLLSTSRDQSDIYF